MSTLQELKIVPPPVIVISKHVGETLNTPDTGSKIMYFYKHFIQLKTVLIVIRNANLS
jgi:hypothetical protein